MKLPKICLFSAASLLYRHLTLPLLSPCPKVNTTYADTATMRAIVKSVNCCASGPAPAPAALPRPTCVSRKPYRHSSDTLPSLARSIPILIWGRAGDPLHAGGQRPQVAIVRPDSPQAIVSGAGVANVSSGPKLDRTLDAQLQPGWPKRCLSSLSDLALLSFGSINIWYRVRFP